MDWEYTIIYVHQPCCRSVDPTISIVQIPRSLRKVISTSLANFSTAWINVSNCVAKGATIAFIFLSASLEDILRSSNCDYKLFSLSLANSPEWWQSITSTKCFFGVLFSSDMLVLRLMIDIKEKSLVF